MAGMSGPQTPHGSTDPEHMYLGSSGAQDKTNTQYAPEGYKWDPVKQQYVRTPGSIASDMSSLMSAIGTFGATSGGGGFTGGQSYSNPQVNAPALTGLQTANAPNVAEVGPIDTSAAQSAAFGRAKDQVGQESAGALAGLRSSLGGRGMLGSGAESRGTSRVVQSGQQQLGEVSRQQAIEKAGLAERQAESNRGAAVTQRGQTIGQNAGNADRAASMAATGYQGQIAQRGQNISQQIAANNLAAENARAQAAQRQSMLTGLMSALSSSNRSAY